MEYNSVIFVNKGLVWKIAKQINLNNLFKYIIMIQWIIKCTNKIKAQNHDYYNTESHKTTNNYLFSFKGNI